MVTEERDLIYDPNELKGDVINKKQIYLRYYSIARLRNLSENSYLYEKEFTDLWQGLLNTFFLFEAGGNGVKLGIKALDGDLFSETALKDIIGAKIGNHVLLECIRNLNEFQDKQTKMLVSINYRSLDVEELGSVYEGLLELHPIIEHLDSINPANIHFTFHGGTERKTTGSYYTRPDLVNELIKSALIPVIEERVKAAGTSKEARLNALLKLKVCDAAAGSGHIVLAAARTIAWYMARIDSGEENPAPSIYRHWLRQAIQHCIYAVDMNPDAVELCKLALWLEGHNSGKPLSFLDHKIRCGNSLVGVADLSVLKKGIPDEAFNPVSGDDKTVSQSLKKANKEFNKTQQITLDFDARDLNFKEEQKDFAYQFSELDRINQDTLEEVKMISKKHSELKYNPKLQKDKNACDLYTAAFFYTYTKIDDPSAPSSQKLKAYLQSAGGVEARTIGSANVLSQQLNFFHWPLEFPDVYQQGGFDVMMGNPPWERIKLQEQEYFETRDAKIANAQNKSLREILIKKLPSERPELYKQFQDAQHSAEAQSKFLRDSQRFILTAVGDINTYAIFSELNLKLLNSSGRAGIIVPTGIATDNTTKDYFGFLVENERIVQLLGFENEEFIFPSVHHAYKFCALTISGKNLTNHKAKFTFFNRSISQAHDKERCFELTKNEITLLNPNSKTCPVFRTKTDFEICKKIFSKFNVLINESNKINEWEITFSSMFHMSNDSNLFLSNYSNDTVPLYEAKMFFQYDHRYSTYENATEANIKQGTLPQFTEEQHKNAIKTNTSNYYIKKNIVEERVAFLKIPNKYLICFRGITSSNLERTFVSSILPICGVGNSAPIIKCGKNSIFQGILLSLLNSLISDYILRQKLSGNNLNLFVIKQIPLPNPNLFQKENCNLLIPKIVELVYTSWDIKVFADDVWKEADGNLRKAITAQWEENKGATGGNEFNPPDWCSINEETIKLSPFKWDEDRPAILKAELDAIFAKLYGITEEELCYILNPQDVYGEDFPGETFRVLKDKEIKKYGEYRTKRLVLEAWGRMSGNTNPIIKVPLTITNVDTMKEFNLHEGIYSIKDTAEITRLSKEKIKRWFRELSKEKYEGIDEQQQSDVDNFRISFHGLIELVVIGTLRDNGVSLKKILKARTDLSSKTKTSYPFATNNINKLKVSGSDIIFEFPNNLHVTLDGKGQINLGFITEFFKDIIFEAGIATRIMPTKGNGKIVIDPKAAGGRPSIVGKEVWVDLINSIYIGPESITMIQEQYNLEKEEILAAVEFSK